MASGGPSAGAGWGRGALLVGKWLNSVSAGGAVCVSQGSLVTVALRPKWLLPLVVSSPSLAEAWV